MLEGVLTRNGCAFGFLFGISRLGGSAVQVSGSGATIVVAERLGIAQGKTMMVLKMEWWDLYLECGERI